MGPLKAASTDRYDLVAESLLRRFAADITARVAVRTPAGPRRGPFA